MISGEFWRSWLAFWFLAGPLFLGVVNIAYCFYLSRHHLDAMMDALKNSRYMYIWGLAWRGQGWIGGFVLITKIAGMVLRPAAYIRIGDVDPVDIGNFPPHLKRLLMINVVMTIITLSWMAITYALLKFR